VGSTTQGRRKPMSAFFANGNGLVRLNLERPKYIDPEPVEPILLPVMTRWSEDDRRRHAQQESQKRRAKQ
jgi:hypothetical protein